MAMFSEIETYIKGKPHEIDLKKTLCSAKDFIRLDKEIFDSKVQWFNQGKDSFLKVYEMDSIRRKKIEDDLVDNLLSN
jgi:hypothetical protein